MPHTDRSWDGTPVRYPDPAIEILDARFAPYRLANAAVERLWSGARWTEGPVYFGDGRFLLFSDIPNNRILRWDEETGAVSLFRRPSHYSNGHTRDRVGRLRDRLESELCRQLDATANGVGAPRIENTLNLCFRAIEGAAVVLSLSQKGICCSSGSACSAQDEGPSHVLAAMRVPGDRIHGAVRYSLSTSTTEEEIERANLLHAASEALADGGVEEALSLFDQAIAVTSSQELRDLMAARLTALQRRYGSDM